MVQFSFQRIIKGCKEKNRTYQRILYKMYYSYAMSISMKYAQTEEEALQITNNSFLLLYSRISNYESSLEFQAWFKNIIMKTVIKHVKKKNTKSLNSKIFSTRSVVPSNSTNYLKNFCGLGE